MPDPNPRTCLALEVSWAVFITQENFFILAASLLYISEAKYQLALGKPTRERVSSTRGFLSIRKHSIPLL